MVTVEYSFVFWFWIQLNESFFMKGVFYCFRSNPTNNRAVDENYVIIGSGSSDRDYFPSVEHLLWPSTR